MAHPMKKEGVTGHNAKLKRMTRDYGAADAKAYKTARGDLENGPQQDPGFDVSADAASMPSKRGDRTRRTSAANPIATYKNGGRAQERAKAMCRADGGAVVGRAEGGRVRKGATNVNIIIAPQQPQTPPAPALPLDGLGAGAPPMPPAPPPSRLAGPAGASGMPGPMPGLPPGAMPPGAVPPGLAPMRKRGGRVHPDEPEDKALVRQMVKPSALKRKRGGRVDNKLSGIDMTAGAATGEGRLEKAEARSRRKAGDKRAEI